METKGQKERGWGVEQQTPVLLKERDACAGAHGCTAWGNTNAFKFCSQMASPPAPGTHTGFLSLNTPTYASQAIPGGKPAKITRVEMLHFLLTFLR